MARDKHIFVLWVFNKPAILSQTGKKPTTDELRQHELL